jgi:predicted nucleotidyltransferase
MTEQEILDYLKTNNMLVFYAIRGSCLYGTNIATSDEDHHGIFHHSLRSYLGFVKPKDEFSDEKHDNTIYELRKYVDLATTANPTILEMLFTPDEYVLFKSDISNLLFFKRDIFLTKKCYHSFSGYAYAQCAKARGKNKKVHGESKYIHKPGLEKLRDLLLCDKISEEWVITRFSKNFYGYLCKNIDVKLSENTDFKRMDECLQDSDIAKLLPPKREQFCYIVHRSNEWMDEDLNMPFRPQSLLNQTGCLEEYKIDLKTCNCSSVEHLGHVYRLYDYGDGAKGIFHGGEVLCSSIPIDHEKSKYRGILIYALNEYESARSEWHSFFEWVSNRNENRWKSEDSNESFSFDRKNMQHTVRLLFSAENIAVEGKPLIRFSGDKLKFLREIREGKFTYEYLMKFAEDKLLELKSVYENCSLPYACNMKVVNDLYEEIIDLQLKNLAESLAKS